MVNKYLLFIVFVFSILLFFTHKGYSWYYTNWNYRTPITIQENSGNTLTDYEVKLTIDTATLISEGKMNSDCSDMRFTYENSTGEYEIPYWIESGCNSANTIVWVKVPQIPASSTSTVYMYYGNSDATSESNAEETLLWYDDFSTDTISDYNIECIDYGGGCNPSADVTISNGLLDIYIHDNGYSVMSIDTFNQKGFYIEVYARRSVIHPNGGFYFGIRSETSEIHQIYGWRARWNIKNFGIDELVPGQNIGHDSGNALDTSWHKVGLYVNLVSNTAKLFLDNTQILDTSLSTDHTSINPWYITLRAGVDAYSSHTYVDYILARSYISPEPTYTIGTEETQGPVNQPPYFWAYNQTKGNTTEYFNFTINTTGPAWFWWSITDDKQVNFSTCQAKIRNWLRLTDQPLLRFINDSYDPRMDSEGWIPYNCTFVEGYDNNKTIRVVVQLNHTYEYWSGVFPFEPSLADTYTTYVVHGDNYLMMELHNVTTEPGTRYIISLWAERYSHTANTRDLNVYICNSSYTTGDPLNNPYCFLTHAINKYEQPNGENEFEYLLPFTADNSSFLDGVKVTPTMKIILRADTAQSQVSGWKIYASNISSTHTYISTDGGDTWTKTQYEANIFLLMANLEQDQHFQINISIADNEGAYNSTNVSIPWSTVNYPPEVAILLDDHPGDLLSIYLYNSTLNITESGLVWINATVYDPDFDDVNCSIYLLNME